MSMGRTGSYCTVLVESFIPAVRTGHRGAVHIRPIAGQIFPSTMFVECSKRLSDTTRYPLGTRFKLQAKLKDREGGNPFLYAYHGDPDVIISEDEVKKFLTALAHGEIPQM